MPYAISSFVGMFLALFLGVYVLILQPKHRLNKIFFWFCLSIFYWGFMEFQTRISTDADIAFLWNELIFMWPFTIALLLHFVMEYTGYIKKVSRKAFYLIAYGVALAWSIIDITSLQADHVMKRYYGWEGVYIEPIKNIIRPIIDTTGAAVALIALVIVVTYYLKAKDRFTRSQARLIAIGLFILVASGVVSEVVLPIYLGVAVPEATASSFALGIIFIAFAMKKYQLFTISPSTIAEDVIRTMPDMLFATDAEGTIKLVNTPVLNTLHMAEAELINQPFIKFLKAKHIDEINDRGNKSITIYGKDDISVPTLIAQSELKDSQGKSAGKIYICHDISHIFETQKKLKRIDEELREKKAEITERSGVLKKLTDMAVDREKTMIKLKEENEDLKEQLSKK